MTGSRTTQKVRCAFCGRLRSPDELVESRDPWDHYKTKRVCVDADSCAKAGRR